MSVVSLAAPGTRSHEKTSQPVVAVALLGTGAVGAAVLRRLALHPRPSLRIVAVANSRQQLLDARGVAPQEAEARLERQPPGRSNAGILNVLDITDAPVRVIVDATASEEVAVRHPYWLARGYHVVTANKALNGGSPADWQAIDTACAAGETRYGASATVGAGLPVIDTLRRWRLSGDRLTGIQGVFSGSLSWLFNHYDSEQKFSNLLRKARDAGYCEPDPRIDLSGIDAARKLLILARSAGILLHMDQIRVDNLVPEALRKVPLAEFERRLGELDRSLAERRRAAQAEGRVLRHIARFDALGAQVGVLAVARDHPAVALQGTENLFLLSSEGYADATVAIRGPGAGPLVTAQALIADVMDILD